PANLHPGLNDIMDVFEEIPLTNAKYLTLWKEIDCKCNQSSPKLKQYVENLLNNLDIVECNNDLNNINFVLEELMPSIEENLHVSTIALDQLSQSVQRLELAYETCLKNGEIPKALRLGKNNHPAMHLHYELMEKASKDTMNIGGSGLNNTRAAAQREQQVRMAAMQKQLEAMGHVGALDKKQKKSNTSTPPSVTGKKRARNVSENASDIGDTTKAKKSKKRVALTTTTNNTNITSNNSKNKNSNPNEETYCFCEQIAYGEMIACDNKNCPYEWFHLQCVGLTKLPSNNKWYCPHCKKK
ncbi:hypothetical protein HANVADRAFT_13544, partial [Hanseniaspora valbyensis NRRL Y-1626]